MNQVIYMYCTNGASSNNIRCQSFRCLILATHALIFFIIGVNAFNFKTFHIEKHFLSLSRSQKKGVFIPSRQWLHISLAKFSGTGRNVDTYCKSAWEALENDFSSADLWEKYYHEKPKESSRLEWHSSIPLDVFADYCLIGNNQKNCLLIGCGTSQLPDTLLSKSNEIQMTLLDSSQTCIDVLKRRYGATNSQITYICGSALDLRTLVKAKDDRRNDSLEKYGVILDKGLMDAFFCSDNWNDPIKLLLEEATKLMRENHNSKYVLVSYKLSNSTQTFLKDIGDSIGLTWEFRCIGSNDRVWISVGKCTSTLLG